MTAYGTRIFSDIDFGLDLTQQTEVRDEVHLKASPPDNLVSAIRCGFPLYRAHGRKVYLYSDRLFDGVEAGQPWQYEVKGVASFYWKSGASVIYYVLHEEGSAALLGFWFVHLLLPLFLTLENRYSIFHGGAVVVEGKAVMFAAPSMGGKSTMTDYFIRKGHTLLSDDKIVTFMDEGKLMAAGSHPYHRPYRKFEDLGYRVSNFVREFKPLHAVYLLEKAEADDPVTIEELSGFEKFHALLPHYLFAFPFLKKARMVYLSKAVNSIRIFRVKRPWDMTRIDEVYRIIKAHSKNL
jgi:hypothetical protein